MLRIRFHLVVSFALIFIISCQREHARWDGIIERENGIIIINNPKKPIHESNTIRLSEELSIGQSKETGNGPILRNVPISSSVDVDKDGNIYVLDWKARQILVFNSEGRYLRSIGRKGQGPGEFQGVAAIKILPANELAVYDSTNRRLSIFAFNGTLINMISNLPGLEIAAIDGDGNLVGTILAMTETHNLYELVKVFVGQKRTTKIGKVETKLPFVGNNLYVFAHMISFDVQADNRIVWGSQESYQLYIADKKGNSTKKITKEYDPIAISDDDRIKRAVEILKGTNLNPSSLKIESPRFRGAFSAIRSDEQGNIYVLTSEKDEKNRYYIDVFDSDGKYSFRIALKSIPILIRNNQFFLAEESKEGYLLIKKYRISWPK